MSFLIFGLKDILHPTFFIRGLIREIFYSISEVIYTLLISLYDMFEWVCNVQILEMDQIQSIFNRVGLILGIVMFFVVAFQFILMVVDPDRITDKQNGVGAVVKKALLVIVMLGTSTFVFNFLQEFQINVINSHIINKLLLPNGSKVDDDRSFGRVLSADLFLSFYTLSSQTPKSPGLLDYIHSAWDVATDITGAILIPGKLPFDLLMGRKIVDFDDPNYDCAEDLAALRTNIIGYKTQNDEGQTYISDPDFSSQCVSKYGEDSDGATFFYTNFNFILCPAVGLFACYFIFIYTISVGVRVIQLTFLQVISPMAIVGYLSPSKDNMFSKWSKKYLSTYLDVFIRIAIINFACYLVAVIIDSYNDTSSLFWTSMLGGTGQTITWTSALYIKVIMILAIFQFAKKAPDLLKEIFPTGGSGIGFGVSKEPFTRGASFLAGAGVGLIGGGLARGMHVRNNWRNDDGSAKTFRQRAAMIGGALGGSLLSGVGAGIGGARAGKIGDAANRAKSKNEAFGQWSAAGGTSGIRRLGNQGLSYFGVSGAQRADYQKTQLEHRKAEAEQRKAAIAQEKQNVEIISNISKEIKSTKGNIDARIEKGIRENKSFAQGASATAYREQINKIEALKAKDTSQMSTAQFDAHVQELTAAENMATSLMKSAKEETFNDIMNDPSLDAVISADVASLEDRRQFGVDQGIAGFSTAVTDYSSLDSLEGTASSVENTLSSLIYTQSNQINAISNEIDSISNQITEVERRATSSRADEQYNNKK